MKLTVVKSQSTKKRKGYSEFLADVVKEMGGKLRVTAILEKGVQTFFGTIKSCVYHGHTLTKGPCYKAKRGP